MWWRRQSFVVFVVLIWLEPCLSVSETILISSSSNTTLPSTGDVFELGFFSPDTNASRWYVGIWYKGIPNRTYVWVANRDSPLFNSNGTLGIYGDNIVLRNQLGDQVWKTDVTIADTKSSPLVAHLLDNGNFVLRYENSNSDDFLWQSFDSPTDTLLPGMELRSLKGVSYPSHMGGSNSYLRSWNDEQDPKIGAFSFGLETQRFPRLSIWSNTESKRLYRSGAWDGFKFIDVPLNFGLTTTTRNEDEVVSYLYEATKLDNYERVSLSSTGHLEMFTFDRAEKKWIKVWYVPSSECDYYNYCGINSYCDLKRSPACNCIMGFVSNKSSGWECVRKTPLSCNTRDTFSVQINMKLPDTIDAVTYSKNGLEECQETCSKDCDCSAFTLILSQSNNRSSPDNCVVWRDNLIDVRNYDKDNLGRDLYIRVTGDINHNHGKAKRKLGITIGIVVGVILVVIFLLVAIYFIWRRTQRTTTTTTTTTTTPIIEMTPRQSNSYRGEVTEPPSFPMMDFGVILKATQSFSDSRKIGEGGFGKVYRGRLPGGEEIAVKKLLNTSSQGTEEFENEVRVIARLQHINLVRLIGWSQYKDERVLVYEYLENGTSKIIFSVTNGIVRGLGYMQEESRLKIVHRDLKPANILLDKDMTPKISDFGLARIVGRSDNETVTERTVGTRGYISPEYALDGKYSTASDVFSFGVVLLEIVSGKKNRTFSNSNSDTNLLSYVWRKWSEGDWMEIVDPKMRDLSPSQRQQIKRCIEIGLLCVQQIVADRPKMLAVLMMLGNETTPNPQPRNPPGFDIRQTSTSGPSTTGECSTINHYTTSQILPR